MPAAQGKGDLQITTLFNAKCIAQMEKLLSDKQDTHAHTCRLWGETGCPWLDPSWRLVPVYLTDHAFLLYF